MSYATIPRPGTVGDNLKSNFIMNLLQGIQGPPENNLNAMRADRLRGEKAFSELGNNVSSKLGGFLDSTMQVLNTPYGSLPEFVGELQKQEQAKSAQVDPNTVMSQETFTEGPPMSMSGPQSTTQPAAIPAAMTQLAAGKPVVKASSRARAESSKPPVVEMPDSAKVEVEAAPIKDAIAEMLAGKKADAEVDLDSAKANALKAKDLSDGEKIFTALMAVLPGLVGAIGGGAIAGGHGAAAGAAGGLTGGQLAGQAAGGHGGLADGLTGLAGGLAGAGGMMMGEKEQLRQEQLDLAKAAQGRIDQVGGQQLGHAEKLQGQEFQVSERKAGDEFTASRQEDQQTHDSMQRDKQNAFAEKQAIQQMRHEYRMHEMNMFDKMALKAAEAAAAGPAEIKDYQGKLGMAAAEMADADAKLQQITSALDENMTGLIATSSWANVLKDPRLQQFAIEAERFLSPALHGETGAAISEAEWENAKRRFIPFRTDSQAARDAKAEARKFSSLKFFNFAGPAAQAAAQRTMSMGGQGTAQPQQIPAPVMSSAQQWLAENPNHPDAAAIRARIGAN